MYSESDLDAAVAAGALAPEAAARFREHVAGTRALPAVDEEHFRLLTGFNDIFVAIAAVILLIAVGWIGSAVPLGGNQEGPHPVAGALVALAAWGLAEFFTARRRMALPSIVLLLAFVGGVFWGAVGLMLTFIPPETFQDNERNAMLLLAAAAATASAAAGAHWRRFKVPITIAAGAAALVALALGLVAAMVGDDSARRDVLLVLSFALGVGVFLFAMRWDGSDPRRQTGRSDVAFWLHLLAAPLIVHPIFVLLGLTDGTATTLEAVIVLLVYVVLGLAALAIDRRALLVSALAYVLYALNSLFQLYGAVELSFALTALVIGSALLLLSAFWHNARKMVVVKLPRRIQSRLPVLDRLSLQPAS